MADSSTVDSVLPQPPTAQVVPVVKQRLFGRTKNVHGLLGGGHAADVLLWKKWHISSGILATVATIYYLFERSQYTLLTLVANIALLLVFIVFIWAQAAHFLNIRPPPLPELSLSEEMVQRVAATLRTEVNRGLAVAHSVALGKDYKLFGKVVVGLYLLAWIGGTANTLTLAFFGVLFLFTLPFFYDKHEDRVDSHLKRGLDEIHKLYAVAETKAKQVLQKIPDAKKAQ